MKSSKPKPIIKAHQQKTTPKSRVTTRSSMAYYARDKSQDNEKTNDLKQDLEETLTQNPDQTTDTPTQTSNDPTIQSQLEAFTQDQDSLTPDQATDWLEQHFQTEGTTVKLTLSPGTDLGTDDLKQWTRDVLSELETLKGKTLEFLSYIHIDTDNIHTHTLLNLDSEITENNLRTLGNIAGLLLSSLLRHQSNIGIDPEEEEELEEHIQIVLNQENQDNQEPFTKEPKYERSLSRKSENSPPFFHDYEI